MTTSRDSGNPPAITTMETRGESNGIGATDLEGRDCLGRPARDAERRDARARRAGVAVAPGRAARGREAHRRGWLLGAAELFDRVGTRARPAGDQRATGRGRRAVAV